MTIRSLIQHLPLRMRMQMHIQQTTFETNQ